MAAIASRSSSALTGLDHRDHHQLVVGPAHVAADVALVLVGVEDPEAAVALRRVLGGGHDRARLVGVADQRHHHAEGAEREHAADRVRVERRARAPAGRSRLARAAASSGADLVGPPAGVLLVEHDELGAGAGRGARKPGRVEVDREHAEHGLARAQPLERGVRPHAVLPRASTGHDRARSRRRGRRAGASARFTHVHAWTGTKVRRSPTRAVRRSCAPGRAPRSCARRRRRARRPRRGRGAARPLPPTTPVSPANVFEPPSIVAVSSPVTLTTVARTVSAQSSGVADAERDLHQVVEDVRAGPHLGDAVDGRHARRRSASRRP